MFETGEDETDDLEKTGGKTVRYANSKKSGLHAPHGAADGGGRSEGGRMARTDRRTGKSLNKIQENTA